MNFQDLVYHWGQRPKSYGSRELWQNGGVRFVEYLTLWSKQRQPRGVKPSE